MRRFELVEGNSAKFWQIEVADNTFTAWWGRLGTAGQSQTKTFADGAKAQAEADKLIREKTGKGYQEVAAEGAATALPKAAPARPPAPAPAPAPPDEAATPDAPTPAATAATAATAANAATAASEMAGEAPPAPAAESAGAPLDELAPIDWTPEWRALCPALPGFPGEPLPQDAAAVWNELRLERLAASLTLPRLEYLYKLGFTDVKELLTTHTPPVFSTPDRDARYFALFPQAQIVDLMVLQAGLRHCFEALVAALEIKEMSNYHFYQGGPVRHLKPWLALRRHIVAAQAEQYAELRDLAGQIRRSGSPLRNFRIVLLFPAEPWAAEEVAQTLKSNVNPWMPAGLAGLLLDLDNFDDARKLIRTDRHLLEWTGLGLPQGLLAKHGPAGVSLLAELYDCDWNHEEFRSELLAAMAAVRTREALFELFDRTHKREVIPVAKNATLAHPGLGMVAIADYLGRRGKNSEIVKPVLRSLITSHPTTVAAAVAKATPAGAGVLRGLLAEADRSSRQAPPELWPEVLRSPPWEKPRKKADASLADAVIPLEPLPYEETMTWLEGERESWLAEETERGTLQEVLRLYSIKPNLFQLAHAGDEAARATLTRIAVPSQLLAQLDLPLALTAWQWVAAERWRCYQGGVQNFLARVELPLAVEKLLEFVVAQTYISQHHLLLPVDSPRVAPRMAMLLNRRRKLRDHAKSWLRRHPRAAIVGLVPQALGKRADLREDAQVTLLFLAAEGHRELLLAIADNYGVAAEIEALLNRDPLDLLPAKIPAPPDFWDAASLTPPQLQSGESLPPQAVNRLAAMLAFSRPDRPYAGIAQVKEACDAGSLAEFSWEIFQSWLLAGAPSKEQWAFLALGILGDDSCARRLAPLIRLWPGEAAHARAVLGLEVLTLIGSDVSLMLLQSIADKVKFKGLQDKAKEKIEQVAEQRGLSAEDLADRLAPDFGLDDNGSLELDFGQRRFRVAFDEQLRPYVFDPDGKRLSDLPKPGKTDDAELAAEAVERFKALKKDVKSLAGMQILRLERAMVDQRRFSREVFEAFFAHHPLIRHLARRLVWAAHEGDTAHYFRVDESGSYTDAADTAWLLPDGVEISVPHPIYLPAEVAAGFGQIFADYEILQPFAQLGREIRQLTAEEQNQEELLRFAGRELPTGKLLGLEKRGWRRGAPQDAGMCWWFERQLAGQTIYLSFHDGIAAGDISAFPTQTLAGLAISRGESSGWYRKELKFAELSPIEASEMLRDLESLVG